MAWEAKCFGYNTKGGDEIIEQYRMNDLLGEKVKTKFTKFSLLV